MAVQISVNKLTIISDSAESYTLRIQVEELKAGTFTNKSTRKEFASAKKKFNFFSFWLKLKKYL